MLNDIQIAQQTPIKPISEIADLLKIDSECLEQYGKYKAKINPVSFLTQYPVPKAKLILVTAINPTKAGEGKTTITIGLTQALCQLGKNAVATLREPSLGPVFGMKGGATGGGYSQIQPMEDINLHFTGDIHAITSAHNLISTAIDNHIWQGNLLNIDKDNITWKRALDINDRAMRAITIHDSKYTRDSAFQITAASEIMAIICLAKSMEDLRERISKITFAFDTQGVPLTVSQLGIVGSVCVLLKDAINPNLVQTLENTPVFVHGGPFANIAHGCSSVLATKMAMNVADYVITEAGFGADLGAEKFLNIKCRSADIRPDTIVLVATIRALKYHGNAEDFNKEDLPALQRGLAHLTQHIQNLQKFHIPVVVAINRFVSDTKSEEEILIKCCGDLGVNVDICDVWSEGGNGGLDLARTVLNAVTKPNNFRFLYELNASIKSKIETIVFELYRAKSIYYTEQAENEIQRLAVIGGSLPICISKTPLSFSDNPKLRGCPRDFEFVVNSVKLSSGAGYLVIMAGDIIDMPGLPKNAAMHLIDLDDKGKIIGLS